MRIGIDAGGTFTDFVVMRGRGRMEIFKLKSNPRDPASVILAGIERAANGGPAEVVHGSTVATNALLERKGVRTAFVTTAGFEDLLEIGRQNRAALYDLNPPPRRLLVPRELRFGVGERIHAGGAVESRPGSGELAKLARKLKAAKVEAVAICFLHSYLDPSNERAVLEALAGCGYVCASHEISPEFREYERASTTTINAYVGPLMDRYLSELAARCPHPISILQSNGGFLRASEARRQAVRTVLSGPAGGVIAAVNMARRSGFDRVIGFDMGGTSTDVSLAIGTPRETTEAVVDGMPVRVPMLDIHTVGAGGGSIARVDEGGLLRVGPESAGADPGPACYGVGEAATVTDAHVVLGRISAEQFLGGQMRIQPERSRAAVQRIAKALGLSEAAAAAGIVRVANANMERAIRTVSVERGHDPREFTLVAFGGGGGLHACELAAQLGMERVLVPRYSEGLSALGMLLADAVRDWSAGVLGSDAIEEAFAKLEADALEDMPGAKVARTADLRYAGQSYELNVAWKSRRAAEAQFQAGHQRLYGYRAERSIEVVTVRVRATRRVRPPVFAAPERKPAGGARRRVHMAGRWADVAVLERAQIGSGASEGPALVLDYGSTTLVPPGWRYSLDEPGNLLVTTGQSL